MSGFVYTMSAGARLFLNLIARQRVHIYHRLGIPFVYTCAGHSASFHISEPLEFQRVIGSHGGQRYNLVELLEEIRPTDTFYEVGANIGVYSCLVGKSLTAGTVVSFEPEPNNIERLRLHLEHNDIDHVVREQAISNFRGESELKLDRDGGGGVPD